MGGFSCHSFFFYPSKWIYFIAKKLRTNSDVIFPKINFIQIVDPSRKIFSISIFIFIVSCDVIYRQPNFSFCDRVYCYECLKWKRIKKIIFLLFQCNWRNPAPEKNPAKLRFAQLNSLLNGRHLHCSWIKQNNFARKFYQRNGSGLFRRQVLNLSWN